MPKRSARKSVPPSKKPTPSRAAPRAAGRRGGGGDRLLQLERLIELMVDKDVVEVELDEGGARLRVRRTEPQAVAFAAPPVAMPSAPVPAAGHGPAAAAGPAAAGRAEPDGEVFPSPMLGTFYEAPSPEAEAFVKVGDRVTPETTLCIIEAMKVMNEIKAERDGEIVEVLVKNGEPVEYGQPLFVIR